MANAPALVRVTFFVVFGRDVESQNVRLQNITAEFVGVQVIRAGQITWLPVM